MKHSNFRLKCSRFVQFKSFTAAKFDSSDVIHFLRLAVSFLKFRCYLLNKDCRFIAVIAS